MFSVYFIVVRLENGLTALLISDTHSATHSVHTNSNLSTTDDDDDVEDLCSDEIEDESDDDDVDGVWSKDADVTLTGGSEEEKDANEDSLRKYSDTRLVSLKIRFSVTCSHSPLSLDQCKMLSFCVLDNSVAV